MSRSYLRDVGFVFAARIVGLLAAIASQSLLAWILGTDGRGEYAACLLFANLLILTFALGQEMANVYYIGSQRLEASEALTQSLLVAGLSSAVACLIGFMLPGLFPAAFAVAPLYCFQLSLVFVPVAILQLYVSHIYLGLNETPLYTFNSMGPPVLLAAGLGALALAGALTVGSALTALILAYGITLIFAVTLLVTRFGLRLMRPKLAHLRRSLGYGVRFYVGKLCSMANLQVAPIILAFFLVDKDLLGMFTAAVLLFTRVWMLPDTLQLAMLPRTVSDEAGRATMVAQVVRICLLACGVLTLAGFVLSKPVIMLLLSPDFLPVLVPVWIMLPGIWVRVISRILPAYFAGIDRPQITSGALTLALVMNLGLTSVLLPLWGLSGAALAMTIAYATEAMLLSWAFWRFSGLPPTRLVFPMQSDWDRLRNEVRGPWARLRGRSVSLEE